MFLSLATVRLVIKITVKPLQSQMRGENVYVVVGMEKK